MKQLLFSVVCILAFSFCQNKTSKIPEKAAVFKLSEHYSKFKFHDLTEFKEDTFYMDERRKRYKELDSLELKQIIQEDKELT